MPTPAGIIRRNVSFGMLFGNESDADLSADVTVTASEPLLVWSATGDCAVSDPVTMNMPAAGEVVIPLIPTDLTGWTKSGVPVSGSPNPTHTYTVTIQPRKGGIRAGSPIIYRGLIVPSGSGTLDADKSAVWTGASGTVTGPLNELAAAAVAAAVGSMGAIPLTQKAAPSGVAELDSAGKLPLDRVPDGVLTETEASATYAGDRSATLRPWRAAAAVRRIAGSYVWHIGDSMTIGGGSTDAGTRGWRALLASNLRARMPQGNAGGSGYWTSEFISLAGGSVYGDDFGPGHKHIVMGSPTQIAAISITGTAFDVVWPRGGGGTLGVKIDSGAVVNVDQSGALTDGVKTRFTMTPGTHTITFNAVSGTCFISGVLVYDGDETTGVRHIGAGHSGGKSGDLVAHSITPGYFANLMTSLPPSLVTISLGSNDYAGGVASSTFKTNLLTIIDAINANVTPDPSIVLLFWPQRTDTGAAIEPYENYFTKIAEVAAARANVTVLDMRKYLGPTVAGDTLGLFADVAHMSDKGHGITADVLTSLLADPLA